MDSILTIFKIGVGPSSSHTNGPIAAGVKFCELIKNDLDHIEKIKVTLYGSLCLTGKGHLTDLACVIGLSNLLAKDVTSELKKEILDNAFLNKKLKLCGEKFIAYNHEQDIVWDSSFLPSHENGLTIEAFDKNGQIVKKETFFSIGGGFIKTEDELKNGGANLQETKKSEFDFNSAQRLLELCEVHNKSISDIVMLRESELFGKEYVKQYCFDIYNAMIECYENGVNSTDLTLPGPLNMKRLAPAIKKRLVSLNKEDVDPLSMIDYVSMYARAVSEENACGGRVVTAPTNGSCGVIPAVLLYIKNHRFYMEKAEIIDFLLTCAAIGYLYKQNASLSGAEVGCQGEVGVASSMAAAGMAEIAGGSAKQILSAAEIAMEHHLGLTCDPVGGLVLIPCIERNVLGAIKAISAAKLALEKDYSAKVSLDAVISTMYQTGKDLNPKYRETSLGGLAKMISC